MQINERFRKFPIKFYQTYNDKGEEVIYFENAFMQGYGKDLTDAFNQIRDKNLDHDLFYYYNDVVDFKIGAFEPALTDKKTKKGKYLGKLNLDIDIVDIDVNSPDYNRTIKYISNNPERIKAQDKYIKGIKDAEKRKEFLDKLKSGFKKVASIITSPINKLNLAPVKIRTDEMLSSSTKTRYDLICKHCGEIIPTGSYYEEYLNGDYHLECLWDHIFNEKDSNNHADAIDFFLSLEKYIKPDKRRTKDFWTKHMDCLDEYLSDLSLFRTNERKFKDIL